jgi:3-phenylpropionate/cinnamic acid dioxygenase small subunit
MGAGTWESHHAITTLMFRYAECVDGADFAGIAELFAHGRITNEGVEGAIVGADAVRKLYERTNRVHDDGTTRTRHVNANVAVEIDEVGGRASARSVFVVFQQTPKLPLQPIVSGRYRDDFAREGHDWRFDRRHIIVDHIGDVREHLTFDLSGFVEEH